MITGNIPTHITILTRRAEKKDNVDIIPAFVSDAKNKRTLETGRNWVKRSRYGISHQKGKEIVGRENKGVGGYRILDLEVRSEGGRAYKVVSPEGFYVDLREDVLLDTIQEVGISPGGILNGTYLFATVGSQMKLIREGSKLHKELIGATVRRASKEIPAQDLEVCGIYRTKGGDDYIFGGFVDTIHKPSTYTGYTSSPYTYCPDKPMKKAQLWIRVGIYNPDKKTVVDAYLDRRPYATEYMHVDIDIVQKKAVYEKVGQLEVIDCVAFVKEKTKAKLSQGDYRQVYSKIYNMTPYVGK